MPSKLPELVIAADRGRLVAWYPNESGTLRPLRSEEIPEGLLKLSEQVTDKAGAFPVTGSNGTTTAAAERLQLESEIEMQSFRKVAAFIQKILEKRQPRTWGFAAPSEINRAILEGLNPQARETLAANVKLDLVNAPPDQVARQFANA